MDGKVLFKASTETAIQLFLFLYIFCQNPQHELLTKTFLSLLADFMQQRKSINPLQEIYIKLQTGDYCLLDK